MRAGIREKSLFYAALGIKVVLVVHFPKKKKANDSTARRQQQHSPERLQNEFVDCIYDTG